ncbi:hypothetical protein HY251_08190, partial [bacterium]|nr:hypothetical protein [bacterium]
SPDESSSERVYVCVRCNLRIPRDELHAAYVESELLCASCRAAVNIHAGKVAMRPVVAPKPAPEKQSDSGTRRRSAPPKKAKTERIERTSAGSRKALKDAVAYGLLFLAGVGGPIYVVFGAHLGVAIGIALPVALLGGLAVFMSDRG